MPVEIFLYGLSTLIVLLGGLSLVLQKVYKIDGRKGEKTIVELPLFGKLSTNYPAIAFVFIGVALAAYTLDKTWESPEKWFISGSFSAPKGEVVNWQKGTLRLSPPFLEPSVDRDGSFTIVGDIKKGRMFEEVVKQIAYDNNSRDGKILSARIMVGSQYNSFLKKEESLIKEAEKNTRIYKPVELDVAVSD